MRNTWRFLLSWLQSNWQISRDCISCWTPLCICNSFDCFVFLQKLQCTINASVMLIWLQFLIIIVSFLHLILFFFFVVPSLKESWTCLWECWRFWFSNSLKWHLLLDFMEFWSIFIWNNAVSIPLNCHVNLESLLEALYFRHEFIYLLWIAYFRLDINGILLILEWCICWVLMWFINLLDLLCKLERFRLNK